MKLSVVTVLLKDLSLGETLKYLNDLDIRSIELGAGGFPGKDHLNPDILLNDKNELNRVKKLLNQYEMEVCALSCHGNPVHPNKEVAKKDHLDFEKTVQLAQELKIDTVITFSGCPGDSEESKFPNWVTCPWPSDFLKVLEYQWNDVLIPYWNRASEYAQSHGIQKIALEMHPGYCVYNPETLKKLRNAVGEVIGANFDPSHLFWQGINPVHAIRDLKGAIHHFHAKDTRIDQRNMEINGVLDTKHYSDVLNRSWVFRTVGYGHDYSTWKDLISMLSAIGYDGAISIEHEDSLFSTKEGLEKAITFLRGLLVYEKAGEMWWA